MQDEEHSKNFSDLKNTVRNAQRALQSLTENDRRARDEFSNRCAEYLTNELGQDGLVSSQDIALYISTLSEDSLEFFNLPTTVQLKFVLALCEGRNFLECSSQAISQSQNNQDFGIGTNEFEKLGPFCSDIYIDLKEFDFDVDFPIPSAFPSRSPVRLKSATPSSSPTAKSSSKPSNKKTPLPSQTSNLPTFKPTFVPSRFPSISPSTNTKSPTDFPSFALSNNPSLLSSNKPSFALSNNPSLLSSNIPSFAISNNPSLLSSNKPSFAISNNPSLLSSNIPSIAPTYRSELPSINSSTHPSIEGSQMPSFPPTIFISQAPSLSKSSNPSIQQSNVPTLTPTSKSDLPSSFSSSNPSIAISQVPSYLPSRATSPSPSSNPTAQPSFAPTLTETFESDKPSTYTLADSDLGATQIPSTSLSATSSQSPSIIASVLPTLRFTNTPTDFITSINLPSTLGTTNPSFTPSPNTVIFIGTPADSDEQQTGIRSSVASFLIGSAIFCVFMFLLVRRKIRDIDEDTLALKEAQKDCGTSIVHFDLESNSGQSMPLLLDSSSNETSINVKPKRNDIFSDVRNQSEKMTSPDTTSFPHDRSISKPTQSPTSNPILQSRSSSESSNFSSPSSSSIKDTLKNMEAALKEMNAVIDTNVLGALSQVTSERSTDNEDMSSLSSHQSSQKYGEDYSNMPSILIEKGGNLDRFLKTDDLNVASKQTSVNIDGDLSKIANDRSSEKDDMSSLSSQQSRELNRNENNNLLSLPLDGREKIDRLIAAGDWDAVARETEMYKSETSTVTSASIADSSTESIDIKNRTKREFLDYVMSRHNLLSSSASSALESENEEEQSKSFRDLEREFLPTQKKSALLKSRKSPSFKRRTTKKVAFENEHKLFNISPIKLSPLKLSPSKKSEATKPLRPEPSSINSEEINLSGKDTAVKIQTDEGGSVTSPKRDQLSKLEVQYIGGSRVVLPKRKTGSSVWGKIAWVSNTAEGKKLKKRSKAGISSSPSDHSGPIRDNSRTNLVSIAAASLKDKSRTQSQIESDDGTIDSKMNSKKFFGKRIKLRRPRKALNYKEERASGRNLDSLLPLLSDGNDRNEEEQSEGLDVKRNLFQAIDKEFYMRNDEGNYESDSSNQDGVSASPSILTKEFKEYYHSDYDSSKSSYSSPAKQRKIGKSRWNISSPFRKPPSMPVQIEQDDFLPELETQIIDSDDVMPENIDLESKKMREEMASYPSEASFKDSLDQAIEDNNWDAVKKHSTQIMGILDSSLSSEGFEDSDYSATLSDSSIILDSTQDVDSSLSDFIDDERIKDLESLIEADDWKGLKDTAIVTPGVIIPTSPINETEFKNDSKQVDYTQLWDEVAQQAQSRPVSSSTSDWAIERSIDVLLDSPIMRTSNSTMSLGELSNVSNFGNDSTNDKEDPSTSHQPK